jgi:protein TonB
MHTQNSDNGVINRGRSYFTRLAIAFIAMFACTAKAELILNGSTIYSDLGKDQFVAALYTETAHNNPQMIQVMESEKRMEVRILNNYSKRRWINLWMQSISINNNREAFSESAEELIALMQAPKSAPKKGDVLEYIFSPENGTSMRFNGTQLISDLSGEVFSLLLRTWIGAIPPSTTFKEELLGNQRNTQAQDLLETLTPNKERISLAASWIVPVVAAQPKLAVSAPKIVAKKAVVTAKIEPKKVTTVATAVESDPIAEIETIAAADNSSEQDRSDEKTDETAQAETNENQILGEDEAEAEEEIDFNVAEALAQRDYTPLVVRKIYQNISYPNRAVSKNQQGTVRVAIMIGRSGELLNVQTTQGSDYSSLDRAALKAVEKSAPFPTLPEQITASSFELSIPITFRLQ